MSCPQYRDSIVLLADGELSEDAGHDVRAHLMGCDRCRAVHGELEKLARLLTPQTAEPSVEESRFWRRFDADLALRVTAASVPFWRRRITLPVPAALALGAAFAVIMVVALQERDRVHKLSARTAKLESDLRAVADEMVFPTARIASSIADLENDPKRASLLTPPVNPRTASRRNDDRFGEPLPDPDFLRAFEMRSPVVAQPRNDVQLISAEAQGDFY